jgi:uncharacterized protein
MELSNVRLKNRLAGEISPYLQQHAANPVAWQPWDDAALNQAIKQDKPIFLSIGYAACHWCHVMEHECFEDESIAEIMNRHFINIKVDREERPDLDDIYMKAVVAMTGQGGWPMSVFLTSELRPFYGGTYFPPERRYGMPGFREVLEQLVAFWAGDRTRLLQNASQLVTLIQSQAAVITGTDHIPAESLREGAIKALEDSFDSRWGGWGQAPKFPSSSAIALLLQAHKRTGKEHLMSMVTKTLDRMRSGGIYDHLGGGFHRYSVDDEWRVPHFEKMLYDNAQLAVAYLEAWQATGRDDYGVIVRETLDYLCREMQDAAGGFYASQDADSEEGEGAYYLWTHEEIIRLLGAKEGNQFCADYGVKPGGNFASHDSSHHGKNVLFRERSDSDLSAMRTVLLIERQRRSAPKTDDKVLTSWNGLAITAFARAALAFGDTRYGDAALKAGTFLRDVMFANGTLLRTWRVGKAHLPAYLDDYAAFANACIDLYEYTADFSWIELAQNLAEEMIGRFHNGESGGFFSTGEEHRHLLVRMCSMHDTSEPSGNSMAYLVLLRMAAVLGEERYRSLADDTLRAAAPMIQRAPSAFLSFLVAAEMRLSGEVEITLGGDREHPTIKAFQAVIGERFIPARVIVYAGYEEKKRNIPCVHGRNLEDDNPCAWVCRNRSCMVPAINADELIQRLA